MRRRTGPVQQWVDSIPSPAKSNVPDTAEQPDISSNSPTPPSTPGCNKDIPFARDYIKHPSMTVSAPISVPNSPAITMTGVPSSVPYNRLVRDPSLQSDSSHCSSVESLLELRKADPEAILLGLGFGGCPSSPQENGPLSRIPRRFLQPSKLKGIAINDFLKHQQETSESFDSASLGYRGLTGSPYVAPSEIVQKIMERLREHESHELDAYAVYNSSSEQYSPTQQEGRLSVLSPDNRQFLDRPRSKSPDMRNKRMIIGQKSFAFGCDGDLIEIHAMEGLDVKSNSEANRSHESNDNGKGNMMDKMPGPSCSNRINDEYEAPSRKFEKRLTKLLSFDEESTEDLSRKQMEFNLDYQRVSDLVNISEERMDSEEQKESLITVISGCAASNDTQSERGQETLANDEENIEKSASGLRRASDGACEPNPTQKKCIQGEGRRFSDGVMQSALRKTSNESLLSDRRKSLKRQARISDADAIEYCGLECIDRIIPLESEEVDEKNDSKPEIAQSSEPDNKNEPLKFSSDAELDRLNPSELNIKDKLVVIDDLESSTICGPSDKEEDEVMRRDTLCCPEERHRCCKSDKLGQVCKHDETFKDCCYHANSTNCWRKMEKIMQKNKKLEDMVVKSRQEMAEIRDMLSSVLSVRMEPGF
ncbi:uncharacterized protein LOC107264021 isoform X2 [Cephus cinctus]|nr:uncharacterized protein LOC107264021 isoform X2 [Cephus cinctus]XP_015587336.1 uncharacterized protein LOC107264021 isoform X2 [Cephus cinctus]